MALNSTHKLVGHAVLEHIRVSRVKLTVMFAAWELSLSTACLYVLPAQWVLFHMKMHQLVLIVLGDSILLSQEALVCRIAAECANLENSGPKMEFLMRLVFVITVRLESTLLLFNLPRATYAQWEHIPG